MNNVQILTDDLMRMSGNNSALFMHKNIKAKNIQLKEMKKSERNMHVSAICKRYRRTALR